MKVPLLDLHAQIAPIREKLAGALLEVLDSTQYIMGPKVEQLESLLASYCNTSNAIGVSSGTDALLLSLMALEVGPGDLVLTTPYSFFATGGAIARLLAKPTFIDIDPLSFNIDPTSLQNWFDNNPNLVSKVKAIIVVHLFGQCADMNPILELAAKFHIPIIEDAAQAIGASYPLRVGDAIKICKAGSMGTLGCYSFFPSKNLGGIGDGGLITCNDSVLADKVRLLRNHGAKPKYFHKLIGGNFRLDPIQAATLIVKLPYLEGWHAARRNNAMFYMDSLKTLDISVPHLCYGLDFHIFNQFVITVPGSRDKLRAHLHNNDIGSEVYYPQPFHLQECFANLGYTLGDFPKSEYAALHSLALPIYPELTKEQLGYVSQTMRDYYHE
jgi:dTDP-4-amino-4,6-dideoxygalactose transaminase